MFEYHADGETRWIVSLSNGLRLVGTLSVNNELRPGIVTLQRDDKGDRAGGLVEIAAAHIVAIEGAETYERVTE